MYKNIYYEIIKLANGINLLSNPLMLIFFIVIFIILLWKDKYPNRYQRGLKGEVLIGKDIIGIFITKLMHNKRIVAEWAWKGE